MSRPKRKIPWLDTRGDVYYVFWYNETSRRTDKLSLGTTAAAEAQDRYAEFLREGKSAFAPAAAGLTVTQALDFYYFEHIRKESVAPRTIENSITHLKAFFGEKIYKDIGVPDCVAYGEWRMARDRPAKASTIGKELSVLKAAGRHCITWKKGITLADMPTFKMPAAPKTKGIWVFKDEMQRLFEAAKALGEERRDPLLRALSFYELCYYTGSRRDAIERLTWGQVDLFRKRIALAKPGEKVTKKRRPTIPIDPLLMSCLKRCLQHKKSDFVLGSDADITTIFETVAKKAGLLRLPERDGRPAAKLTPHMLRHSRATHLLQDGKSPWAVASLLGDTVETVTRVYGHHSPSFLEDQLYGESRTSLEDLTG